jgi:hypothetical protein
LRTLLAGWTRRALRALRSRRSLRSLRAGYTRCALGALRADGPLRAGDSLRPHGALRARRALSALMALSADKAGGTDGALCALGSLRAVRSGRAGWAIGTEEPWDSWVARQTLRAGDAGDPGLTGSALQALGPRRPGRPGLTRRARLPREDLREDARRKVLRQERQVLDLVRGHCVRSDLLRTDGVLLNRRAADFVLLDLRRRVRLLSDAGTSPSRRLRLGDRLGRSRRARPRAPVRRDDDERADADDGGRRGRRERLYETKAHLPQ